VVYGGTQVRRVYPAGTLPWAGDASLGYVPVGYQHEPGYPGSLTDGTGLTIASNTTYSYYLNPGDGQIGTASTPVSNVTFIGCAFSNSGDSAACAVLDGTNITFRYCTFQPFPFASYPPSAENSPVPGADGYQWGIVADGTSAGDTGTYNSFCNGMTVDHCDFWGIGNGGAKLANGSSAAHPYVWTYNWIHNHRISGTDHQDGVGSPGGGSIDHLTFGPGNNIIDLGDTQALTWATMTNCEVSGNILGGYGYTVDLGSSGTTSSLTVTGNTYTTQYECNAGPLYDDSITSSPGFLWRGNKWLVPPGAFWGHTTYNGYFWLPGFTSSAGPSLDELAAGLVSTTDFM